MEFNENRIGEISIDAKKLAELSSFNEQLNEEYGKPGTPTREEFHERSSILVLWAVTSRPQTRTYYFLDNLQP